MKRNEVENNLIEIGYPPRDLYSLPSSPLRFKDGSHYRYEVSGVERLSTLYALLDEQAKQGVPIHRLVCTVMGSTYLTSCELKEFAKLANQAEMEVILSPGPRGSWEVGGKTACTPEGFGAGGNLRGADGLLNYILDIYRCLEMGFRGFLCLDEGAMLVMNELRDRGKIPADTIFKISVATGHGNPGSAKMLEMIGADTMNPSCDVTLPQLASMRSMTSMPFDLHVVNFDAQGGQNRMWEAADLARIASPVYFKIEPGESFSSLYKIWNEKENTSLVREKVRLIKTIEDIIAISDLDLICSEVGCADLRVPLVCEVNCI